MKIMDIQVKQNTFNGGECCEFEFNGKSYYADKAPHAFDHHGPETMIFEKLPDGDIDWSGVYKDRTDKSLLECIEEFMNEITSIQKDDEYLAEESQEK